MPLYYQGVSTIVWQLSVCYLFEKYILDQKTSETHVLVFSEDGEVDAHGSAFSAFRNTYNIRR